MRPRWMWKTTVNRFDLLTQFRPREQSDGFPHNDATQDPSATDGIQVEGVDDLDLRHVSQVGPATDDTETSDSEPDDRVLRLHNPAENGGIVYFVVDQKTYSIDVGQTLAQEHDSTLEQLDALAKNIEQVRAVVAGRPTQIAL